MVRLFRALTTKEWRFIAALSVVLMVVTTAPLLYGFLTTDANHHFTGTHFSMPNDWFVYYAYITQGAQGHWLFADLFTATPHLATLNIFWLLPGLFARITHASPELTFTITRLALIPIAISVLYILSALFFTEHRWRYITTATFVSSSGLGVLLLDRVIRYPHNYIGTLSMWPIDIWVPESGIFTILYYSPHFIASFILFTSYFIHLILFVRTNKVLYSAAASTCAGLLFFFHPFHAPTIFAVTGVYFLVVWVFDRSWFRPALTHGIILVACSAPALVYYSYLINHDAVMYQKTLQNICTSPALWLTLIGYGVFWLAALRGAWVIVREHKPDSSRLLLVIWAGVQFAMLYSPLNFQRRLNEGLIVPLLLLSVITVREYLIAHPDFFSRPFIKKWRWVGFWIIAAVMSITVLFHLAVDVVIYTYQPEGPHRITRGIYEAAQWLSTTPENSVILNSVPIGVNPIPAYSGRAVYVGHGVETPFWREKQADVVQFFAANHDETLERTFLYKQGINYVLYGPDEMALGSYTPQSKSYLKQVYRADGVAIYKVY